MREKLSGIHTEQRMYHHYHARPLPLKKQSSIPVVLFLNCTPPGHSDFCMASLSPLQWNEPISESVDLPYTQDQNEQLQTDAGVEAQGYHPFSIVLHLIHWGTVFLSLSPEFPLWASVASEPGPEIPCLCPTCAEMTDRPPQALEFSDDCRWPDSLPSSLPYFLI